MRTVVIHTPLLLPFILASGALGGALLSQYGFGAHPCHLCLLQRYPYAVVIGVASLGMILRRSSLIRPFLIICVLGFLTTSGIGAYHFAVENGWISGPDSCTTSTVAAVSLEALKAQILGAPLVSCGDVGVSFAGLSMAGWNALYGLASALVSLLLWKRRA